MGADTIGIIPARYASSRFPGKPLAEIDGRPMVCRVFDRAAEALGRENVYVATDDRRIADVVESSGGTAVMTSGEIANGTARCAAALKQIDRKPDFIINIQGDEPMIAPKDIRRLADALRESDAGITTLARRFDPEEGIDTLISPDNPKVVMDCRNNALYFSRAVLPHVSPASLKRHTHLPPFYLHTGTYAFRREVLDEIVTLPEAELEKAERLEQLRWLAAGYRIKIVITDNKTISIDTPSDLEKLYEATRQI